MAELDEELDAVSEAKARAAMASDDTQTVLGEEFNTMFGDANFDINSIPDREANELSESEMARIADMQLDDLLDGTENVSIESLFGSDSGENASDAAANIAPIEDLADIASIEDVADLADVASVEDVADLADVAPIEDVANLVDVAGLEDISPIEDIANLADVASIEDIANLADVASLSQEALDGIEEISDSEEEISAAQLLGFSMDSDSQSDVLDEAVPIDEAGSEMSGKKHKKKKKSKKKAADELEDGLPKKSFGQKLKGLFFEIDDTGSEEKSEEDSDNEKPHNILSDNEEELDENEKLLKSMYGNDIDGKRLDEEEEGAEKLGFFAKIKLLFAKKKAQNAIEEQEEDAAEALEDEERKAKKQEKKEANAAKKEAAKAEKEAKKKEPKPEKPKKEPKPKKVKEPPKPGDILKIKPKSMVALVLFVAGFVILVNLANGTFHYNSAISRAKLFFQNGSYSQAYDELSGLTLEESDYSLYDQVCTIMVLEKQITSHDNYLKIKDPVKALDSLIKGVSRYQKYSPQAEKLGVSVQFEAAKDKIVKLLIDNYGITYEKACEYIILGDKDFVQYYHTIESYGGK